MEFDRDRREKFVVTRITGCDASTFCHKRPDLRVKVPKATFAFGLGEVFIEGKTPAAKFECREVDY